MNRLLRDALIYAVTLVIVSILLILIEHARLSAHFTEMILRY